MTKEEKIVLALSLIEQTKRDLAAIAAQVDKSLVTRMETNLEMVADLITGKYNATEGAAAAQTADDYRALVCVFLLGGNDHHNTVIATDAVSWAEYQRLRTTPPDPIALPAPILLGRHALRLPTCRVIATHCPFFSLLTIQISPLICARPRVEPIE